MTQRIHNPVSPIVDYFQSINEGLIPDRTMFLKFGRNSDIDAGPEDIWEGGGEYTGQPENYTPETVTVVSSSANDTSAGTGARTVRISGLKTSTSTEYETEDFTLNGTSAVTSTNTWWRVNRAYVLTAGSGGNNAGTITIAASTTTANVFAAVPAGYGQSQIAAYTVPFGCTGYLKRLRMAITRANGSAGSATATMRVREPGGVYLAKRVFELGTSSSTEFTSLGGDAFSAGTDIKFRIDTVSDTNAVAEAAAEFLIIK